MKQLTEVTVIEISALTILDRSHSNTEWNKIETVERSGTL